MVKLSKLNLILIIISIISIGITIIVLLENRKKESENTTMEIPEPITESENTNTVMAAMPEPIIESEEDLSVNPFDKSLSSPETGEFVKSLINEYFYNETNQSRNGTIYQPFKKKIRNIPSSIDYNNIGYGMPPPSEEVQKIINNDSHFHYEAIEPVIDNLQLVNCEKVITRSSKVGYLCGFILPSLDGTGLNQQINRVPTNFEVLIVKEELGYSMGYFE